MEKLFSEVFPTLKLDNTTNELLKEARVLKVSSNRNHDYINVYINNNRLIPKFRIYKIEDSIKTQLFPGNRITIKVYEHFDLSDAYTPKKLYEAYRESMLFELRRESMMEYNMLSHADINFLSDKVMSIKINDSVISRQKIKSLKGYITDVFNERCGVELEVHEEFTENFSDYLLKENEIRMRQEIDNIVENSSLSRKKEEENSKDVDNIIPKGNESKENNSEDSQKNQKKDTDKAKSYKAKEGGFSRRRTSVKEENMIYGRDFEGEEINLCDIAEEMGEVIVKGKIIEVETREIRDERTIITFTLTDFTDSIQAKIFVTNEELPATLNALKKGKFVKVKGVTALTKYDRDITINSVRGIKPTADFSNQRMDTAPVKRVELHCHTKMSDMDGVSDVKDIVKQAIKWGHSAIAITDHGAIQAFPDAHHVVEDSKNAIKVIYGVEAYLVDDLRQIVEYPKDAILENRLKEYGQNFDGDFVVFDLETTGFSANKDRIIEIGAVKVSNGKIEKRFSSFVNPKIPIPFKIEQLTGINDDMVLDAPVMEEVLPEFLEFCKGCVLVAHNASFDVGFIKEKARRIGKDVDFCVIDTVGLARLLLPNLNRFKLDTVAKALNISLENHHRAVDDAACTAEIFVKFIKMLKERDIFNTDELYDKGKLSVEAIQKLKTYHAIILARNDIGRVNLYRLVSMSHLKYFHKRPIIPKSEFSKYREGLILGSACEAGELFQAMLAEKSDEYIAQIVNYYDYLEVQPIGNNRFMIASDKHWVKNEEDLRDLNRKIIELGDKFKKPVVATCDVHFLNPEDEVYRRIIMKGKGFDDADNQAPLFLHTTDEMLEEFSYLGYDKAREIVIDNPNFISDCCENISPVRPDKCPPQIENSDATLTNICLDKAKQIYGENLPEVVDKRLKKELNSIISNGFAVMYIIAQKLVWKSNDDGYLVGSRGSVGSSFVATMAGITEVNPLSPHYICPKCHYYDFDSEEVKSYAGRCGVDMPDATCPKCGERLKKEGFDIPFETFLGFKGNKEPDIDLNFSGDYQSSAHKYTEVIFGEGHTFKAGTIGTLADKTAFGYVKNYYQEKGIHKRNCEITRLVGGCVGVRRTTGQHPGGIVVLPHGEEIYSFTPVQHPANDMTSDIITTHFDYHSIDHNLLKLDILGHDDPTMIRMLEDLTGLNAREIPLDDQTVMSLFTSTKALGIEPEDIDGCTLGSLGIPEFGTEFVIQMLKDTKPSCFSDLIRISGLSHGTDVWLGNAQTLIEEGKATISTAICTRDDIMTYLINKGVESELSFNIMEKVRKGKGLNDDFIKAMKEHDVPDWYIWSCQKIQYMFPKAHAAAYVMMAWRIAYCKVFYPLAYYAAYFSIRAKAFDYEMMCLGKEKLEEHMEDLKRRKDTLTENEKLSLKDMRIVQEMYARGFEFLKIDIFKAGAKRFKIIDGKLMPALNTIAGLGDSNAEMIEKASKDGPYLSKDDFRERTKTTKTTIEKMVELRILENLPESNQLSLFDFI
ncbi:DNA polymerase-3 subunit alpha [Acetitomaculum ruminis DSM 5522]|uniref:DNA polymerase III PolC-type n=1 Tax=Acetitomaculum ruminis DSM 5522 TaxID=1120918 RepID=A0A1I1A7M9_9FIRM|nr:PolC-type DNA polymerase III [Acetitomaculum ruminis]SFB33927.1 DNA polymerase-3 subunit alpha [Acetitomaculum ruminis DSM 5522]